MIFFVWPDRTAGTGLLRRRRTEGVAVVFRRSVRATHSMSEEVFPVLTPDRPVGTPLVTDCRTKGELLTVPPSSQDHAA
jgi:hypothetical protein